MRSTTPRLRWTPASALAVDGCAPCPRVRHHCPIGRVTFAGGRNVWVAHRSVWSQQHPDFCYFYSQDEAEHASALEEAYALTFAHRTRACSRGVGDVHAVSDATILWKSVHGLPFTKEECAHLLSDGERLALLRLADEPGGRASAGRGMPFDCSRKTARDLNYHGVVRLEGDSLAGEDPVVLTLTAEGAAVSAFLRGQG